MEDRKGAVRGGSPAVSST